MLSFARERASESGLDNVEFVERDAEQLDFEPESFDAVISRATLMLLPDVAGTLARLHSFLRPPGRLGIHALADPARLCGLVSTAGFRGVRTDSVSAVHETDTPDQFTEFLRDVAPPITRLVADLPADPQRGHPRDGCEVTRRRGLG